MMKTKCGLFLPSCAEIATAILEARRAMFYYAITRESEMQLAFDCKAGKFVQYATPGEYWRKSLNKPVLRVPYREPKDAREIAKAFRAMLHGIYYSGRFCMKGELR